MKRITHLLVPVGLLLHVGCTSDSGTANDWTESEAATAALADNDAATPPGDCRSASRDPKRHWRDYLEACMRAKSKAAPAAPTVKTVEQDMVPPDDADFSRVPVWNDADIVAHFKLSRDIRNILPITPIPFPPGQQVTNTAPLEFIRRLSWQYPNDGCFARAELVTSMVTDPAMRPYKLFSFGDLVVSSDNDDEPVVWWYHVVPVVRSASTSEPWVLDAAIDPSQPLPWRTWLVTQGPFIDGVTVADSYAYTPGSPVTGGSWYKDHAMLVMQNEFLHREWDRQVDLGRDPYARFGEYPPWYRLERFYFVSIDPGLIVPSCLTCLGSNALLPRCLADCE